MNMMLKKLFAKIISSNRNSNSSNTNIAASSDSLNTHSENISSAEADLFASAPNCTIEFTVEKPVMFDIVVPKGRDKPYRKTGYLRRKRQDREHPSVVC